MGEAEAVVEVGAVEVVAFEAGVVQEVAEVDLLEVAVVVDLGAEGGFRRTVLYYWCFSLSKFSMQGATDKKPPVFGY